MTLSDKPVFAVGFLLLIWFSFSSVNLQAQEGYLTGRVVDSLTREPLAFVSIVYNAAGQGVVTNLDGNFRVPFTGTTKYLKLRYVGYHDKIIPIAGQRHNASLEITLTPKPFDIGEVVIHPTENPAHRIIRLATENRNRNNPEKSGPFSYISYEKLVFGLERDTSTSAVSADTMKGLPFRAPDTLKYGLDQKGKFNVQRLLENQYLFMMETVSSRKFLSPEKNKDEVIASKVSGISQPSFVILARQFQSFSFYDNFITIANRQFLNPIAPGSLDKYFFLIQDTLYTERHDTVFIISFRPYKGRNFEGMQGTLYINSHGWAIQNVLARAYDQKNNFFTASIQQQYDLVNGERWFPVLLSSTIEFKGGPPGQQLGPLKIVGTGKAYITNINFHPQFTRDEFSNIQMEVSPNADRQSPQTWNKYRVDSLSARENETYRVIDSIGKAQHLDRTLTSFETLLTGYLPGRYFAFDLRRFIDYNAYEGFRFGAGGHTTRNVSKWFSLGGYLAYSLRDKAFKYSGSLTLNPLSDKELGLTLTYRHDVRESGGISFNEPWNLTGSAFVRQYLIKVMDVSREAEVSINWRSLKFLTGEFYLSHGEYTPTNGYGYRLNDTNPYLLMTTFYLTEAGFRFRYAYGETFMKTPRGNQFSLGTKFPVACLNIARGGNALLGDFRYWRTELKIAEILKTKSFGNTHVALIGGYVTGQVPYSRLYAGLASYRPFTLESEQSFGTMRLNEFLSDRFVGLFLKQDFGKLLFKPRGKFQPEIALVHNLGFGYLAQKSPHANISYKTFEKGYFEGGILINNLFRIQFFHYGLGVMYRYGPYAFHKTIDNFAFKLTLQLITQ